MLEVDFEINSIRIVLAIGKHSARLCLAKPLLFICYCLLHFSKYNQSLSFRKICPFSFFPNVKASVIVSLTNQLLALPFFMQMLRLTTSNIYIYIYISVEPYFFFREFISKTFGSAH
jgi:hypothetical protein